MLTSHLRPKLILLVWLLCPLAVQGQSHVPRYTITELGDFSARALNNSTTVVGSKGNTAVMLRNGVLTDITPVGSAISQANALNDLDQVVGSVLFCDMVNDNCVNARTRAFLFDRGTKTVLSTLGGRDSQAFGINNTGQIAGWSHTAGPPPGNAGDEHAFIFQNGVFEDLGKKMTARNSVASSINATGQVSGWGRVGSIDSDNGAFLYSGGAFQFFEPTGTAFDINDGGQVVGVMGGNDDGSGRAFLFSGGLLQDLGVPSVGYKYALANAINNAGDIVGFGSPSFFSPSGERAFIFSSGSMQDLNNLIPENTGWVLSRAVDINDAGQIVGDGFKDGQPKAFLLTPTQPLLMTEPNSTKAVVLESIAFFRDPFGLQTRHPLSPDRRTRLTIISRNIELIAGETILPLTVQAENSQHQLINLPVEYIGKVPGATWLTQITVRLPDQLNTAEEIQLRILFRGQMSNAGSVTLTASP